MAKLTKTTVRLRDAWVPIRGHEVNHLSPLDRRRVRLRQLTLDDNPALTEVEIKETWLESPLGDDWIVAYRMLSDRGAPTVGEIRVFPNEAVRDSPGRWGAPPNEAEQRTAGRWSAELLGSLAEVPAGGITRQVLDRIRLSEPLTKAGELLGRIREDSGWMLEARGLTTDTARRRGRKGYGDRFYAQVARDYVAAVEAGSMSPATDVARRRRLGPKGPARVRDLLYEARRRGLLSPAPVRGRRGQGDLTPAARALLAAPGAVPRNVPANVPAPVLHRPHSTQRQPRSKTKTPR